MTCASTPYSLAFPDIYSNNMISFDITIDVLFFVDVIINFLCAYYNTDFEIIDDYKVRTAHILTAFYR